MIRTQATYGCTAAARSLMAMFLLIALAGCAAAPYRYGGNYRTDRDVPLACGEPQIERGRRAPVIDTVGWIVGIPAKIVMLNHRVDNHRVSPETEASIQNYLTCNDLDKVKVRINQYDPAGEWNRLKHNEGVRWPIRYTIGSLSVLAYTVFPGRIWGGDQYNPFTNTVNVYSDVPGLALYQGGFAKDYAQREYKGLYAVGYVVPGLGLWQEIQASGDAMTYIQENGTSDEIRAGYRSISPAFALHAISPFSGIGNFPVGLTVLAAGHLSGQLKASQVHDIKYEEIHIGEENNPASPEPMSAARTGDCPNFRVSENGTVPFAADPTLLR